MVLALALASARAQTPHTVTLTWTDPNNPTGTEYNIYKASGVCTGSPTFAKVNTAPVAGLTFIDSGVAVGAYCYYITATNGTQESAPSPEVNPLVIPFAPVSLQVQVK